MRSVISQIFSSEEGHLHYLDERKKRVSMSKVFELNIQNIFDILCFLLFQIADQTPSPSRGCHRCLPEASVDVRLWQEREESDGAAS